MEPYVTHPTFLRSWSPLIKPACVPEREKQWENQIRRGLFPHLSFSSFSIPFSIIKAFKCLFCWIPVCIGYFLKCQFCAETWADKVSRHKDLRLDVYCWEIFKGRCSHFDWTFSLSTFMHRNKDAFKINNALILFSVSFYGSMCPFLWGLYVLLYFFYFPSVFFNIWYFLNVYLANVSNSPQIH